MDSSFTSLLTPEGLVYGPSLIAIIYDGYDRCNVSHSSLYNDIDEKMNEVRHLRLWKGCKLEDTDTLDPRDLVDFLVYSPRGLLWKLQPGALQFLGDLLEYLNLSHEARSLQDWHDRARLMPSRSVSPTTTELYYRCAGRLSWHRGEASENCSHLLLDVVGLWEDDPELFELGGSRRVGRGSYSVAATVRSKIFQEATQQFQALCRTCKPLVIFDRETSSCEDFLRPQRFIKLNVVAFFIYLRCCTGPARHYILEKSLLQRALYGPGNVEDIYAALRETLNSIFVHAHWPIESCDIHRLSIEGILDIVVEMQHSVNELSKNLVELSQKVDEMVEVFEDDEDVKHMSPEKVDEMEVFEEMSPEICSSNSRNIYLLMPADEFQDEQLPSEMPASKALVAWTQAMTPLDSCCCLC